MRAQIVMMGWLVAGCSVQNPWFGLAGEGETMAGETGTGAGPGGATLLPTTQGPGGSTDEPPTTSTGPLTATEAGTTTGTGVSTGMEETGVPGADLGGLCGNGVEDPNEECDDGNDVPGDVCEGNCRRMFRFHEIAVGSSPRDIAAADLDGDGRTDLVVSHATAVLNEADYSVLQNQGGGGFTVKAVAEPGWTGATRVLVGQLVGDARPDLLLLGIAGTFLVLENLSEPGMLKFTPVKAFQGLPPGLVPGATLSDLDGNGFLDLLLLSSESLHVYRNNGGSFMPAGEYGTALEDPNGVVAGAVLANDTGPHVVLSHASLGDDSSGFINDGGVLTEAKQTAKHCPSGASSLGLGDADKGGPFDLVFGCANGQVTVAGIDAIKPYVRSFDSGVPPISSVGILDIYDDDEAADVYGFSTASKALVIGVAQGKQFGVVHIEILAQAPGASVAARIDDETGPDIAVVFPAAGKVGLFLNQTRLP